MGLLRTDLDESTLSKLSEAVQQSARHNLPYADSDVEQQVDVWMEGLLANDQVSTAQHSIAQQSTSAPGHHTVFSRCQTATTFCMLCTVQSGAQAAQ
jgi:hypothetical protein